MQGIFLFQKGVFIH